MDNKWLLVKSITLLYRESLIPDRTENSADLVRTVLESIKLPEMSLSLNHDRERLMGLKDTALQMCNANLDQVHNKEDLLQTLKINCNGDESLYNSFAQGIEKDMDEGSLKRTILSIKQSVNNLFRENEVATIIGEAARKIKFDKTSIKNMRDYVRDFLVKLEPYQIEANRTDPAVVGSIDLGETDNVSKVFEEVKELNNSIGILKTGWQGLNRMLNGGFRRGETWTVGALPHMNKTGFTLSIFRQIAMHNVPVMKNASKKPLLLRISFEDSLLTNLQFLYQLCYENQHNERPDFLAVDSTTMASYVREQMEVNGYKVKMERVNPSEWTYKNIQNRVMELEANGYEIHILALDYLPMLPTTGCETGPAGHDIRDLYRRMRNFCSSRSITMLTPHQLSTEAKNLIRDGHSDFVKKMPGGGFYAGSKQIDQESDGELFIHIEKINGVAYQTVQRGKHRGVTTTPEKDKYIVYKFPEAGRPILDDINKEEITLSKVGGEVKGSINEVPFWESKT